MKKRRPGYESIGEVFGKLTVFEVTGKYAKATCACGSEWSGLLGDLRRGVTMSCGCFNVESHRTHAMSYHPLYDTWAGIRGRCLNPRKSNFKFYGARGVKLFGEWVSDPLAFINWVENNLGPRPSGEHSIDRIDNINGHYEPGNLRWATYEEQGSNRRGVRYIDFNGQTKTLSQWCRQLGICYDTTWSRLKYGWSIDEAFGTPTDGTRRYRRRLKEK